MITKWLNSKLIKLHILTHHIAYSPSHIHVYMYMYKYTYQGWEKVQMFESSFVCCPFEAIFLLLNLSCHPHLCNLNMWSIMWVCSRNVETVLLAASVSFFSPPMLSRISERNNTSTHYKAIIQFQRHSLASQGKSNIDKNTCERSNIHSFLVTKL